MPVEIEWKGDEFEQAFFVVIGKEMEKAQHILSVSMRTALQSAGKGSKGGKGKKAVHSPPTSKIPYTITGTLARSWGNVTPVQRKGRKFITSIYTTLDYAWYLLSKAQKNIAGGRPYMDKELFWWKTMVVLVQKRFDTQRLINAALRNMR
jgi:hypothetical protein